MTGQCAANSLPAFPPARCLPCPSPPHALPCGQAHSGQWEAELHVLSREGQAWPKGAGCTSTHVTAEPRPWQLCDASASVRLLRPPPAATLVTPSRAPLS